MRERRASAAEPREREAESATNLSELVHPRVGLLSSRGVYWKAECAQNLPPKLLLMTL